MSERWGEKRGWSRVWVGAREGQVEMGRGEAHRRVGLLPFERGALGEGEEGEGGERLGEQLVGTLQRT